jgi:hypothetical protein
MTLPLASLSDETLLLTAAAAGVPDDVARQRRLAASRGESRRLIRGVYITDAAWLTLDPATRHAASVLAVIETRRNPPIVGHESAAILWGMPIIGPFPTRVHTVTARDAATRSTTDVAVHREAMSADDIVELDGVLVTSPLRTLTDLARTASFDQAVAAIDFALNPKRATRMVQATRQQLLEHLAAAARPRGEVRARRAILFGRPHVDNAGESRSRVLIDRLGFPEPLLQVRHRNPPGRLVLRRFRVAGVHAHRRVRWQRQVSEGGVPPRDDPG